MASDEETSETVPALIVENAGLKSHRGWVFRDITFNAHAGEVTTVTGPAGTGRSTLLLACAEIGRASCRERARNSGGSRSGKRKNTVRTARDKGSIQTKRS